MICYQASLDNVSLCTQGHNACRTCADKLLASAFSDKCPLGCAELHMPNGEWIGNRALNEMVRVTPFKCPHAHHGCKHSAFLTDMSAHTKDCPFEEIGCKVMGCEWRGPKCQQADHLQQVNHCNLLADMITFVQHGVVAIDKTLESHDKTLKAFQLQVQTLTASHTQWGKAIDQRLDAMSAIYGNLHRTCKAIEEKLGDEEDLPLRGSSRRTERRDRKTAKDLEAKDMELFDKNDEIAQLTKQLDERPTEAFVDVMSADLTDAARARDRFFRERDSARSEVQELKVDIQTLSGQKRRLESTVCDFRDDRSFLNVRLHDTYASLRRFNGCDAHRSCPCLSCSPRHERHGPRPH